MHVENQLPFEPTTLHWHGLYVPAAADGGPHNVIEPGDTWQPEFRVQQRASTLWYHSHLMGKAGEQVNKGLAGLIIIDDEECARTNLPSNYGVDDIPLIVQDRRFNEDGSFGYVDSMQDVMAGLYGDRILVNGTISPVFTPETNKIRFRVLNGANARIFNFGFSDERAFDVVASDGRLLSAAAAVRSVVLDPGERVEIVVDFSNRKPVQLISKPVLVNSRFAPPRHVA